MKEYQDLTLVSDAAYRLADLITGQHYNNIIVYEFHEAINPASAFNSESGLESFIDRNLELDIYDSLISPGLMDEFPAIIHVAVKISGIWFFSEDCGSNYYLGHGPSGIIKLRESCHKNGVKIFVLDETFEDWKSKFLNIKNTNEKPTRPAAHEKKATKTKTISNNTNLSELRERKQFEKTIKSIQYLTTSMQEAPQEYKGLNEENIRDRMFTPLNVIFEGRVSREEKNCKGKTDITIKTADGKNKHIFELKVWKGPGSLKSAITQLQGYLSWHNNYSGLIVFCYELGFTDILEKTKQLLVEEYKYSSFGGYGSNEFRFHLPHLTDTKRAIQTHLTMINLKIHDSK